MTKINVYNTDAETIEKIANDNNMCEWEVVEMLMDYVEDMKRDNNLN